MTRVETRGPKMKMKNNKEVTTFYVPHSPVMSYSTTICKLVGIVSAVHESDCRISNQFNAKTARSSNTVPSLQCAQIIHSYCVHCAWPVNHVVTCQNVQ